MLRIGGIASGMDTESMVKELMKAEHMSVDKVYQQKQLVQWQQEDFREANIKLLALQNFAFDMKLQGSFNTKKVSSSNEFVLTASRGRTAVDGNYTIKVGQLAAGVTKASAEAVGDTHAAASFTLKGKEDGTEVTINVEADEGPASVAVKINEQASTTGIKAFYDENLDKFFLTTTATGQDAQINITADADGYLENTLHLYSGTLPEVGDWHGQNAKIEFNGVAGLEFSTNQFALNGINFDLKSIGTANVSVKSDVDATVDKIKSFVEAYNTAIDYIGTKTSEKRERKFPPLTDAQKADMEEKDIEAWEKKARSGLLRADSLLYGIQSNMRTAVMDKVEGLSADNKYTTLSSIGISTAPYAWNEKGKLHVDDTKLREALQDNPAGVQELFTGAADPAEGLASKLYDAIESGIKNIKDKAGSSSGGLVDNSFMGKELDRINDRLDKLEDRLVDKESFYWKRFTAMEKYIEQMNAQSTWLTQQLGGGQ